jgi:hypothetical protein
MPELRVVDEELAKKYIDVYTQEGLVTQELFHDTMIPIEAVGQIAVDDQNPANVCHEKPPRTLIATNDGTVNLVMMPSVTLEFPSRDLSNQIVNAFTSLSKEIELKVEWTNGSIFFNLFRTIITQTAVSGGYSGTINHGLVSAGSAHYDFTIGGQNYSAVHSGANGILGRDFSSPNSIELRFKDGYVRLFVHKNSAINNVYSFTDIDHIPIMPTGISQWEESFTSVAFISVLTSDQYPLVMNNIMAKCSSLGICPPTYTEGSLYHTLNWLMHPLAREVNEAVYMESYSNAYFQGDFFLSNDRPKTFKDIVEHYFGQSSPALLKKVWPVFLYGDLTTGQSMVGGYAGDPSTVVVEYTKMINMHIVQTLANVKNTLGFDHMYNLIDKIGNRPLANEGFIGEDCIKKFSEHYTPQKITNVLATYLTRSTAFGSNRPHGHMGSDTYIEDICRMIDTYKTPESIPEVLKEIYPDGYKVPKYFKDLVELHDTLSRDTTRIKTEAAKKPIPVNPMLEDLEATPVGEFTIHFPRHTTEIVEWGKHLEFCIANYTDQAVLGHKLFGALKKDGIPVYCAEFIKFTDQRGPLPFKNTDWRGKLGYCLEFRGHRNSEVPDDVKNQLTEVIDQWGERHFERRDNTLVLKSAIEFANITIEIGETQNGIYT